MPDLHCAATAQNTGRIASILATIATQYGVVLTVTPVSGGLTISGSDAAVEWVSDRLVVTGNVCDFDFTTPGGSWRIHVSGPGQSNNR